MRGAITSRGSELWAQVSCDNVTACCSRAIYCNRALKRGYLLQRVCQSHNTGYRSISQNIENNTYIFQAAVNSASDAVLEYLSRQAVQWSWWWREVTGGDKRCHVTEPSRKHLFSQLARIVSLISAIVGFLTANGNSFMEALFPLSRTGSVLCETFHSE